VISKPKKEAVLCWWSNSKQYSVLKAVLETRDKPGNRRIGKRSSQNVRVI
jgi:hypothetical protein